MGCRVWLCHHMRQFEREEAPLPIAEAFSDHVAWIVPAYGYAQVLSLQEVARYGVSFPIRSYFPAQFLWQVVQSVYGDTSDTAPLNQQEMTLCILSLFQQHDPSVAALSDFLRQTDSDAQYQLARSLARVFERYRTYRPDWLLSWGQGIWPGYLPAHQQWQALLWMRIAECMHIRADAHPILDLIDYAQHHRPPALPSRVVLFFLPTLVPLYWSAFSALSRWCTVDVWALMPSDTYWSDLSSEELTELPGAFLLSSWGRQSQDMLHILLADPHIEWMTPVPYVRDSQTSLARMQIQIRDLMAVATEPVPDDSLHIISCPDFLAELRVCKSWLLSLLSSEPDLSPADVLVWIPDLAQVQNHVHAIFGDPHTGLLPYQLSGLPSVQNTVESFFVSLLMLLRTRFVRDEVWTFLHRTGLMRFWGWTVSRMESCMHVLDRLNVRWGLDAEHVAAHGGDGHDARYTWLGGLRAMYLSLCFDVTQVSYAGYALSDRPLSVSELADWDDLYQFFYAVQQWRTWPDRTQLLSDWLSEAAEFLGCLAECTFPECTQLLSAMMALGAHNPDVMLSYDAFVRLCEELWTVQNPAVSPQPSVVCAPFGALRGLPYRVMVALGMQKSVLPKQEESNEYDLLRTSRRVGDRYVSDEQKSALLDVFMQAEWCYLSYHDDALYGEQARSFLMDDVCFFLSKVAPTYPASAWMTVIHDPAPPTETAGETVRSLAIFATKKIPQPCSVSVSLLSEIVAAPARFFARQIAGIHLPVRRWPIAPHEPTTLSHRDYARLMSVMIQSPFSYEVLLRHPLVPPLADLSDFYLDYQQYAGMREYLHRHAASYCGTVQVYTGLDGSRVVGHAPLFSLSHHALFFTHVCSPGLTPWCILSFWIRHVWLTLVKEGLPVMSCLCDRSSALILPPLAIDCAAQQMASFCALASQAQVSFVPFYLRTAYLYEQCGLDDPEQVLAKARLSWVGDRYRQGEKQQAEWLWCGLDDEAFLADEALFWSHAVWSVYHQIVKSVPTAVLASDMGMLSVL